MSDRRPYLLSVDILADVSNLLVDFLFMLLSLMELSTGFSKLRLFLLHQRHKLVSEAAHCRQDNNYRANIIRKHLTPAFKSLAVHFYRIYVTSITQ